jgi:predicted SnoaL-like aldol condensation-catalyzing enzyme
MPRSTPGEVVGQRQIGTPQESCRWAQVKQHLREDMMTTKTSQTSESTNKALVLVAFDTLFNKRDYVAAGHFWSTDYIQHSAHIASGRDGLFDLIKIAPATLKYEPGTTVAEGDSVIAHGRYSGLGLAANWIVADIVRSRMGSWWNIGM